MKYWFRILLTIMLLMGGMSLIGFCDSGNDLQVKINPVSIRPGDFFQVMVEAPPEAEVEVTFMGVAKRLQPYKEHWQIGLIASSYYSSVGMYPLVLTVRTADQPIVKEYQVEIVKHRFPESRIKIDEQKRRSLLTPENEGSDEKRTKEIREFNGFKPALPFWNDKFIWPVNGKTTTGFGLIRFVNDIEDGRHSGLDIAASTGTPVLTVNDGLIVFSDTLQLTGQTIIIYHGLDLYSSYGHLATLEVKTGDRVTKGQIIGRVGATGLATGPHLHLTFRVGDIAVDPTLFLDRRLDWIVGEPNPQVYSLK